MGGSTEVERLKNLQLARRTLQKNQRPLELQKKYAQDEIAFLQPKLMLRAESGNYEETLALFERMIYLRAKLAAIELVELEREELIIEKDQAADIIGAYREECYMLARATDTLLAIE